MGKQPPAYEKQYTAQELAEMWKISRKVIVRMFENEPGVLKITADPDRRVTGSNRKTLRIPQSVMERVYEELEQVTASGFPGRTFTAVEDLYGVVQDVIHFNRGTDA